MHVDLTVHIWKEGNQYVAHAMPLDVMSSGSSQEAAREALDEAVRAFLLTAADAGTLEEVLEECGYERRGDAWVSPDFAGRLAPDLHKAGDKPACGDPDLR